MIRPPALLFGVPIADLSMSETIAVVGELIDDGRSFARSHQIATTNVDFLVNALENAEVRAILQGADVCLADGMPVVWGAALLGMPITERVAGSDLVPRLVEASASTGWRIHVFGSSPSVADRAAALFAERCPGGAVSFEPGPQIPDPTTVDDDVIEAISATGADVLCVALGNPKQERFIATYRERLGIPVMIGVGGSLDMFVGERRRAPEWMQRTGTEWIARLVQEPGRLGGRYAHDLRVFGPRLAREWRMVRARRDQPGLQVDVTAGASRFGSAARCRRQTRGVGRWAASPSVPELHLSCGATTAVRDKALAVLIGLVGEARRRNVKVLWLDDRPRWSRRSRVAVCRPASSGKWRSAPASADVDPRAALRGPAPMLVWSAAHGSIACPDGAPQDARPRSRPAGRARWAVAAEKLRPIRGPFR